MMIKKRLLIPGRARQIPPHFSWIDHRLIRHECLRQCESPAWALYLAAATVADAQGLSYYSDASLCRMLHLEAGQLEQARQQLIAADVLAYEKPLYQVLDLQDPCPVVAPEKRANEPLSAGQILQRILSHGGAQ
jgi:hypothetical protein